MSDQTSETDLPKAANRLAVIFAGQVLGMVLIVAGGVALVVTFGHNNSVNCDTAFGFASTGGCHRRSYALPIGLLAGGFGLFTIGMVLSARIALRTGASVLSSVLARRQR